MQSNRLITFDHPMDAHFLVNAVQVFLTNISNFDNLTCVDLLRHIYSRCTQLLFHLSIWTGVLLHDIRRKLGFAHLAILSLAKYVIHENDEAIYFANLRLPRSLTST